MTIDEAIKYYEEKAKELSNKAYEEWGKSMSEEEAYNCNECAREHDQLARWLKELKALKEKPQGDLISREALKEEIEKALDNAELSEYEACICVTSIYDKCIDNAPTVKPQLPREVRQALEVLEHIKERYILVEKSPTDDPNALLVAGQQNETK